jgi:dihydroorotase (multifunctional complex type)
MRGSSPTLPRIWSAVAVDADNTGTPKRCSATSMAGSVRPSGAYAEAQHGHQGLAPELTLRCRACGVPGSHLESRPVVAEVEAIQRVALFAEVVGARMHIFHLSSRDGLETVKRWRARGVDITAETGPHYCFLTSDDMHRLGAMMRINPPVREPGHTELPLRGLAHGEINAIATDHSPHQLEDKLHTNIWQAVSGFAGVETSVRLFLTNAVNAGHMTLEEYARAASEGPARAWGLYPRKGAIQVGADADLTIIDLEREGVIDRARMHGRNNHSPFEGQRTRGEAVATVVRGQVVMCDGELVGSPCGRMVRPMRSGGAPLSSG